MTTRKAAHVMTLPERVEELQAAAGRQMHEAIDFLGTEPRRVAKQVRTGLTKRGRKLGRRAEHAVADVRTRAGSLAHDVRVQVEKAVEPLRARLDVATRAEVERLRKRVDVLEKKLGQMTAAAGSGKLH